MIRMIPCARSVMDELETLSLPEGWVWEGETEYAEIGLSEAVWRGPAATRIAFVKDRFLDLQYIVVEGFDEAAIAFCIANAIALHDESSLLILHAEAPGPAERAQSLLALSLLTGAEAAADAVVRQDLAAEDPGLRAAAVIAAAHLAPSDIRTLLDARRRVETNSTVRQRLDEVLGALGSG